MTETHRLNVIPERCKRNLGAVEADKWCFGRDLWRALTETSCSKQNHPGGTCNSKQETAAKEESPLSSQDLSTGLRDASSVR